MSDFYGKILVVDDDLTLRRLLETTLEASGFHCDTVANLTAMRQAVKERTYDAVLLDLILDEEDGLSAIPFLVRESPGTKIIMMSAHGTIEVAVSAMEKGAAAFISKSKDSQNIIAELKRRLAPLAEDRPNTDSFGLIGTSQAVKDIIGLLNQIKNVDTNVLITGETGTGKKLVARAIHRSSQRRPNRFEGINCGAIPGNVLESELFGHKKGAFAEARTDREGVLKICTDGTLLLGAIGEMPVDLQIKFIKVLQEKTITPVGSTNSISINTRIVAVTDHSLLEGIKASGFREDLYYQLAVINIEIPPLRERVEDIPLLINHFLEFFNQKFGKSVRHPGHSLEVQLNTYSWPGNIRELRSAVERGVVLAQNGELLLENMLENVANGENDDATFDKTLSVAKQEFERKYLQHLLEATRGNISEMARISGRYRTDIYRLLAKHGVDWEEFRPDQDQSRQ